MIKLTQATKVFDSRGIAGLRSISLEIPKGTIFALMGPNGSGKTTLLNLLLKKIPLDAGTVQIEGRIHSFEKKSPPAELNVQKFLLENVSLDIEQEKKIQLTRDLADIFEFTFQLRQNIGQLSQGQLQKILVAAELINHPDILFLDEPFIHLDPMTRKDILDYLFTYIRQKEMTVIWITHEREEALRFGDLVGLLHHGQLEQVGRPVNMLQEPRNLFVAQFFGHKNFIKITKQGETWMSPWGPVSSQLEQQEAFLVIPPSSWKISSTSSFEGEITRIYPQAFVCELEVSREEKRFEVYQPLSSFQHFRPGQKIKVAPVLEECFLVPL